jgi:DNA helicase-2/ATP-dependent DNA helicase PcrA
MEEYEKLQEEYRLFYVAITRAKDKLTILYPRIIMGYRSFFSPPSRFLEGIPEELYERRRIGSLVGGSWCSS